MFHILMVEDSENIRKTVILMAVHFLSKVIELKS